MDYEKKYRLALCRIKVLIANVESGSKDCISIDDIKEVYSELAESEDERIRKELIESIKGNMILRTSKDKELALAWLEKQGEQKPQIKLVFPKFRVGDIIQRIPLEKWDTTKKITHIDETGYHFDHSHLGDPISGGSIGFSFENKFELVEQKTVEWSEEDAMMLKRAVDVIRPSDDCTSNYAVYKREIIDWLKSLKDRVLPQKQEWNPDDEQYLLVCKNALAKYQTSDKWDAGIISRWLEKRLKSFYPQQKPVEWRDADEKEIWEKAKKVFPDSGNMQSGFVSGYKEAINSLYLQPKVEWSEEDESIIKDIKESVVGYFKDTYTQSCILNWLKSLRPQKQWKPTEAMLEALKWAKSEFHPDCIDTMDNLNYLYKEIEKLYYDRT